MRKLLTLIVRFTVIMFLIYSCSKDDEESYQLKVRVTVNDTTSVQNAYVEVYAPVNGTFLTYDYFTDENGETNKLKLKNKAIVEIKAGKGSFKGCGFAEIERGPQMTTINMVHVDTLDGKCK